MRTSVLFAVAACAATASAQLRLPFNTRSRIDDSGSGSNARRSLGERRSLSGIDVFFDPRYMGYFVNVTVGTPPQEMAMTISVQSGESWVPDGEENCPLPIEFGWCGVYGAFIANESSTCVNSGVGEFTLVQPGGTLRGEVINETLRIGGTELANINLGLVYAAGASISVLGLGFNDSSAYMSSSSSGSGSSLPTVPERLLRDGHIKSTAYSVWFNDESGASGSLLLGAVDKSKFDGPLTRFPIKTSSPSKTRFDTILHSVNGSKSPADVFRPLLDPSDGEITVEISPEKFTVLPYKLAADIYELVGAVWSEWNELWLVPCSANASEARLTIGLHGAEGPALDVHLADLVIPWEAWRTKRLSWDAGLTETDHCIFGVQSANSSGVAEENPLYQTISIGGAALRRTYMVFDLAGEEIAIAKARFGSTAKEDVVAFASYGAAIPESTGVGASNSSPNKSVPLISVTSSVLGLILFGLAI